MITMLRQEVERGLGSTYEGLKPNTRRVVSTAGHGLGSTYEGLKLNTKNEKTLSLGQGFGLYL